MFVVDMGKMWLPYFPFVVYVRRLLLKPGTGRDGTGRLLKYGTTGRDRNLSVRAGLGLFSKGEA